MTAPYPELEALTKRQADLFNADAPVDQKVRIAEEIRRVQEQHKERKA